MKKYSLFILLFWGCKNVPDSKGNEPKKGSASLAEIDSPIINYDRLKEYLLSSDSVVLFSHHSPNEPIWNKKTGEYSKKSIPFIENGKINYSTSVQERKQLTNKQTQDLIGVLTAPGKDDSIRMHCFQPRNAVVAFKKEQIAYFDFCFDCYGFNRYGDFGTDLIMNTEKYKKLSAFFKKLRFKYEMN